MAESATWAGLAGGCAAAAVLLWPDAPAFRRQSRRSRRPRRPRPAHDAAAPVSSARAGPREVAAALELIAIALGTGCPLIDAVEAVAQGSSPVVRRDLAAVAAAVRWGMPWGAAWAAVGSGWAGARRASAVAAESGAPPSVPLARAAAALRAEVGTRAQVAASRLGVHIVLPLGLAYLPAFVVLTVLPLVVALARQVWR